MPVPPSRFDLPPPADGAAAAPDLASFIYPFSFSLSHFLEISRFIPRFLSPSHFLSAPTGQKLYFASKTAAAAYVSEPRDFWLGPHDLPLAGMDGKRGLPDMRHTNATCPESGEVFTIAMATPRVIHRGGQNLYFCCFGCVVTFWTEPGAIIKGIVQ